MCITASDVNMTLLCDCQVCYGAHSVYHTQLYLLWFYGVFHTCRFGPVDSQSLEASTPFNIQLLSAFLGDMYSWPGCETICAVYMHYFSFIFIFQCMFTGNCKHYHKEQEIGKKKSMLDFKDKTGNIRKRTEKYGLSLQNLMYCSLLTQIFKNYWVTCSFIILSMSPVLHHSAAVNTH